MGFEIESFQILQVIGLLISGFLLAKTILDYRKGKIAKDGFIVWSIIWGAALISFTIPNVPESIFRLLAPGNILIIALILANVFLFILVYVLFGQVFALNKRFKLFLQRLALDEKSDMEHKGDANDTKKEDKK